MSSNDFHSDSTATDGEQSNNHETGSRRRLLQGLASLGAAGIGSSLLGGVDVASARPRNFVERSGTDLTINGQRFHFSGANAYQIRDPEVVGPRRYADRVISAANDLNVDAIRTWAFWENGNEGAGKNLLDHIVKKAGENDIRLVLALDNHWFAYDGVKARFRNRSEPARNFYTQERYRREWRRKTFDLLNRTNSETGVQYKDDPTIMIWEVMNEPRVANDPGALQDWLRHATGHISHHAPNQLVSTGLEGFYNFDMPWIEYSTLENGHTGNAYVRNHQISSVDVCSFHLQPDDWAPPANEHASFGAEWIRQHVRQAHEQVGKPAYLGEFGTKRRVKRSLVSRWFDALDRADADGGMIWNLTTRGKINEKRDLSPQTHQPVMNEIKEFSGAMDRKSQTAGGGGGGGGGRAVPNRGGNGPVSDGTYKIINVSSGKVLDVSGRRRDNGRNVHQWEDHNAPNQQWRLRNERGAVYRIEAAHSGKVLDVSGGRQDNGRNVHQWEDGRARNQRFKIDHLGNGEHLITATHSDKAIEVSGFADHNGANVQQWDVHRGDNQRWWLLPV